MYVLKERQRVVDSKKKAQNIEQHKIVIIIILKIQKKGSQQRIDWWIVMDIKIQGDSEAISFFFNERTLFRLLNSINHIISLFYSSTQKEI